jgi:hypothetical protein
MVTPGSVGDWMQALTMAAALVGLAAACGRSLREEDRLRCHGGRDRHGHRAALSRTQQPRRTWRLPGKYRRRGVYRELGKHCRAARCPAVTQVRGLSC